MNTKTDTNTIRGSKSMNGSTEELVLSMEPILQELGFDRGEKVWLRVLDHDATTIMVKLYTEVGTAENPNTKRRVAVEQEGLVDLLKLSEGRSKARRIDLALKPHVPDFLCGEHIEMAWSGTADELVLTTVDPVAAKPRTMSSADRAPIMPQVTPAPIATTTLVGQGRFTNVHVLPRLFIPDEMLRAMGVPAGERVRFTVELKGTALIIAPRLYTGKERPDTASGFEMKDGACLTISDIAVDNDRYYPITMTRLTDTIWVLVVNLA